MFAIRSHFWRERVAIVCKIWYVYMLWYFKKSLSHMYQHNFIKHHNNIRWRILTSSSSLYDFLYSLVSSSLLGPNSLLTILFSHAFNSYSYYQSMKICSTFTQRNRLHYNFVHFDFIFFWGGGTRQKTL